MKNYMLSVTVRFYSYEHVDQTIIKTKEPLNELEILKAYAYDDSLQDEGGIYVSMDSEYSYEVIEIKEIDDSHLSILKQYLWGTV